MKTKKWAVERTRTIQGLVDFIKKFLKLMASEQLFIYVNQSFAPSPDQEVGTLYEVIFTLNNLSKCALSSNSLHLM
ncbi:ubiquitin-like protein ATG12 [Willisornis vidua]|uniref:Ubiquitin-like protein ATG12 n=1 Tax=Willisornis vidua TaxID=1566151 RepID=A0ABQ9DYI5_9PASS|nr:ubiquitin-like protein ATG12 [Willisornis vidua]